MTPGSVDPATYGPRRPRGQCQRCGWTDALRKVRRHHRSALGADRHMRFLCDECIGDLSAAAEVPRRAGPASSPRSPSGRDAYRSVA